MEPVFFNKKLCLIMFCLYLQLKALDMIQVLTFGAWVFCDMSSYMELLLFKLKNFWRPLEGCLFLITAAFLFRFSFFYPFVGSKRWI